jgi:ketosteroid isomerase-like protein
MIGSIIAKSQVLKSFNALNNRDLDAFLSAWHDNGTFIYPSDLSVSGTFQGKQAVRNWFDNFFRQFPEIKFTVNHICVDRLFDITGTNTIAAQWNIEVTNKSGLKVQNIGINVIKIDRGKITEARDFFFYPERLKNGWEET